MTYVVTNNCIQCKYTECVSVCPTNCFHEGYNFVVINPKNCIDCSLCESVCPVNAIYQELEIPITQNIFITLNADLSKKWPSIIAKKNPLPNASTWENIENKLRFLKT